MGLPYLGVANDGGFLVTVVFVVPMRGAGALVLRHIRQRPIAAVGGKPAVAIVLSLAVEHKDLGLVQNIP